MTVGMGRVRKCGKVYDERRRELDADNLVRLTVRGGRWGVSHLLPQP